VDALRAEIEERERATAALARKNAELYAELQRRLTESESFSRVLVSLLHCLQVRALVSLVKSA
jgi:CRISPR/Cas system CSM-associated protein Csm2 small subunit